MFRYLRVNALGSSVLYPFVVLCPQEYSEITEVPAGQIVMCEVNAGGLQNSG